MKTQIGIGLCLVSTILQAQEQNNKPNIIVFIADDLGMDLSCYGAKGIKTPNIDKLAHEGVMFTNMFHTAPQSSPSRTCMMSGQFAHTIGTEDLHVGINDTTKLLPYYLKQAGYHTGILLKTHIGNNGIAQYDYYDKGTYDYFTGNYSIEKMLGNIDTFLNQKKEKPFFLWCGFIDPHRPYTNDEIKQNIAPEVTNPNDIKVPPFMINDKQTRKDMAHYYDEIVRLDAHVGRIMDTLESRGLLENTLILFLSDNGSPMPRSKGFLYDSGIRSPFIAYWKNKTLQNVRYENLSSTIDIAPTILDVAGLSIPAHMYGKSMKPAFNDLNTPGYEYVFSERNWHGTDEHIRSVRTQKYKMIVNEYPYLPVGNISDLAESGAWFSLLKAYRNSKLKQNYWQSFKFPRTQVEIYDLENDPNELHNLAEDGSWESFRISKLLLPLLDKWKKETKDIPSFQHKSTDKSDRLTGLPFTKIVHSYND